MKRQVAVLGVGQTQHAARRADVSIPGLVREAVDRALADAGLEHRDIDAVVIGKAPDMLEGIAMPEQSGNSIAAIPLLARLGEYFLNVKVFRYEGRNIFVGIFLRLVFLMQFFIFLI